MNRKIQVFVPTLSVRKLTLVYACIDDFDVTIKAFLLSITKMRNLGKLRQQRCKIVLYFAKFEVMLLIIYVTYQLKLYNFNGLYIV